MFVSQPRLPVPLLFEFRSRRRRSARGSVRRSELVTAARVKFATPLAYNRRCGRSRINLQRRSQLRGLRVYFVAILLAFRVLPEWRGVFRFGRDMTRVAVYIDYQNVYMGARSCFGDQHAAPQFGQVLPLRTGILLTDRGRVVDPDRELTAVHIFRGEPSGRHSPVGQ
jgi:hypothetical protein